MNFDAVDKLMHEAVLGNVFPGGVLLVAVGEEIRFWDAYGVSNIFLRQPTTVDTIFDLASLTKPLATTTALMVLEARHRLDTDADIGTYLPWLSRSAVSSATTEHLLRHTAGLPAYRPFYTRLRHAPARERPDLLRRQLAGVALEKDAIGKVLYSDVGFIILGQLVEARSGRSLDRFVDAEIFSVLGKGGSRPGFRDLTVAQSLDNVAATELCHWRRRVLQGAVHDDNAYAMGGVAGHAGLFGDAIAVHRISRALARAWEGDAAGTPFDTAIVRKYLRRPHPEIRPLGFDTPAVTGSSCGKYFSFESVGHLGFTGTSLWMDLPRSIQIVLLTNRVHPNRSNERIRQFRPRLHNSVMRVLLSEVGG